MAYPENANDGYTKLSDWASRRAATTIGKSTRADKLYQEHSNPGQRKSGADVKAGTLLGIYFTENLSSQQ